MGKFLKKVLGTFLSLLVAYILFSVVVLLSGALILTLIESDPGPEVPEGSILVLDLGFDLTDSPREATFEQIVGEFLGEDNPAAYSLLQMIETIDAAAADSRISGMLIHGSLAQASLGASFASLQEVRSALERFQAAGKRIHTYLVFPTTGDYYLASVADELTLNAAGGLILPGLASERLFVSGALEKAGIGVNTVAVGDYKSAADVFTRQEMSEADREQTRELLDDLWLTFLTDVSESRAISTLEIDDVVGTNSWFLVPEEAQESGLIDEIVYLDETIESLVAITGREEDSNTFVQIDFESYAGSVRRSNQETGEEGVTAERLAVVYIEGIIVPGEGEVDQAGGDRIARNLRAIRQDDEVGAVVIRVNSPGGSALASEVMAREIRLLAEVKPVVISMGGLAASGGYWVSAPGDYVFAEPTSITGSIGVVVTAFHIDEMLAKLGITTDRVKTNEHADVFSIFRPKTPEELARLQLSAERIYDDFLERVAEGRDMDVSAVREIAGGRVWSGADALEIGLVDALGGLEDAIAEARTRGGLSADAVVEEYPRRRSVDEVFADLFSARQLDLTPSGGTSRNAVDYLRGRLNEEVEFLEALQDPTGIYALWPYRVRADGR